MATIGVKHLTRTISGEEDLIIIREEYIKIWSYIEETSGELNTERPEMGIPRGLVVWGHPGIGEQYQLTTGVFLPLLSTA